MSFLHGAARLSFRYRMWIFDIQMELKAELLFLQTERTHLDWSKVLLGGLTCCAHPGGSRPQNRLRPVCIMYSV